MYPLGVSSRNFPFFRASDKMPPEFVGQLVFLSPKFLIARFSGAESSSPCLWSILSQWIIRPSE